MGAVVEKQQKQPRAPSSELRAKRPRVPCPCSPGSTECPGPPSSWTVLVFRRTLSHGAVAPAAAPSVQWVGLPLPRPRCHESVSETYRAFAFLVLSSFRRIGPELTSPAMWRFLFSLFRSHELHLRTLWSRLSLPRTRPPALRLCVVRSYLPH